MVELWKLSRAEGKAYVQQFLGENDAALSRLREQAAGSGGPTTLDLTVASLGPLWAWAVPRASWRTGWVPLPPGEIPPRLSPDDLEPADELPSWFAFPGGDARFSAETLWLLDGLGRYLGQTLVANVPGATWVAGHNRHRGYQYENHPVVRIGSTEWEPMQSAGIVLGRAIDPWSSGPGPTSLDDLYTVWTT